MDSSYWRMSKHELAAACLLYAQRIENRGRRTEAGDEIAALLTAAGWELYGWGRREGPPSGAAEIPQESLRNP